MPGATITLTATATGVSQKQTADEHGGFEFATVRIGAYVLTAEQPGFSVALADNIQLTVGARQRVDLTLQVGQVTERVEVSAAAARLETDSSDRAQVITGEQIRALPLNGREYSSLALLTTGVRLSALNTGGFTPREGSFNVNGLRSTFNNFLIDGVDNNAYGTSNQGFSNQVMQPSPDAVAEFKVVTSNMSAEYGRAGGATINVAYAAGTNAFKGSAWEFNRDTRLNATGFFKPANGEKPPLERNQFGGVLGGPILRNKAFFFADYEGFRQTRGVPSSSTIPTVAQRQGLFTFPVRNPLTGDVYPAGTPVPMTAFARKVLGDLPAPTNSQSSNNYTLLQQFDNVTDKAAGKIDASLSPGLRGFARYGYRDVDIEDQPPIPLPSGGGGNGRTYVTNKQLAAGVTYVSGTRSLLEARFGWSDTKAGKNPFALGSASAFDTYGITGLPTDERVAGGLPAQLITGFSDLGRQATNPQWQYPAVYNPKINYTSMLGRHSLKSGYEFQHIATQVQDVNPLYGRDQYVGQFTRPATEAASSTYNLADFMLGLRSTYALSNILIADLRQNMHFAYLQDDVRVTGRLTLNVGVRYEYATPWVEKNNVLSNFDPATRQMVIASDGSLEERSTIKPDRNNFGPRLGFAYTLTPATVVRGGYGKSFVHFHRAGGANVLPINGPQVITAVVVQGNPLDPAFRRTEQGYPTDLTDPSKFNPLAANITYMPNDYHSSEVQSWFVSVQRELGRNMLLDLAYVGNRGDDLLLFANFNQAVPNNAAGSIPLQARRPIPEYADITYSFNGGKSRYHALQAKFDWRMRGGLSLLTALTLSRAKDNGSGSLENPNGNFPAPAGLPQHGGGLRSLRLPPAVQQHDQLRVAAAVHRSHLRRMADCGRQQHLQRRAGDLHLQPVAGVSGVRHSAGFPGREQLPAQRDRRSAGARGRTHGAELVQSRERGDPDGSEPAVRQRRAQQRARPAVLAARPARRQARADAVEVGRPRAARRVLQSAEPDELPRAERQPEHGGLRHDHADLRSASDPVRGEDQFLGAARFARRRGRGSLRSRGNGRSLRSR